MAISSYEKNGKILYRVYVHERGKKDKTIRVQRTKAGLKTLTEARREEKKLIRELVERIADLEAKGMTWRELIHRWEIGAKNGLAGKIYSYSFVIDHVNALLNHTPTWLDKRILELSKSDGRYVLNELQNAGYSLSRIKSIKGSINKVWNWGKEEGFVQNGCKSPISGLELQGKRDAFRPILTLDEIRKLLFEASKANHPWKDIWAVAVLTGMRSGELYALTWEDVDLEKSLIRITKTYSHRIRGIKSTKNSEWRNAHISSDLKEVLIDLKRMNASGEYVLPRAPGWVCGNGGRVLRSFLTRIGIEKYVNFHTLRACFATHVLASGAEPTQVMKMGGWADFKTFQIYVRMAGVDVKGVTDNFRVTARNNSENILELKRGE